MRKKKARWNAYAFYAIVCAAAPTYMYAADKIYRTFDENGVPVYSNTPPGPDARALDMPELSIIPPPQQGEPALRDPMQPPLELAESTSGEGAQPAPGNIYKLSIVRPERNEVVPIAGNVVEVELAVEPALNVEAGHRFEIVVDGAVSRVSRRNRISLPGLDSGGHLLRARIVDADGAVVQSTNPVNFFAGRATDDASG